MDSSSATLQLALVGQPNVGKSTVFNALTGLTQYVSNWPGKTCEQKTGLCRYENVTVQVVDLPGVYSLTANSAEERITRDTILRQRPDVVAVVIDAVSLERGLYLVAELMSLPSPMVVGINMLDLAAQEQVQIDLCALQFALGLPVIPMVASRGEGVQDLVAAAVEVQRHPAEWIPNRPEIRPDHRQVQLDLERRITGCVPAPYPADWVALKLLEGDREVSDLMCTAMGPDWALVQAILAQHEDAFLAVASGRYEWIGRIVRNVLVRPKAGQVTVTDHLDRVATHPIAGMLLLVGILGLLFWLTYTVGTPLQTWLDLQVVQTAAHWTRLALQGAPPWLAGLAADGIVPGVGTVLTLLPILIIFFLVLGLLEEAGYMSRAAYVMDRFMHLMGLHGKSFLPLFLGFGCNVPAVMGTRMIESRRGRLLAILVIPLVPCTARLSVVALLAPIFFPAGALWVSWGLIGLSLAALTLLGISLQHFLPADESSAFILELPLYHVPNLRTLWQGLWQRLWDFLQMAGSIILVVSVLMWALAHFPGGAIDDSYLAMFGRLMEPLGRLMGLDWQMMVALLSSFVRKENTIPTLAVLYGAGQAGMGLSQALSGVLSPPAALAFLTVQVLFIPCVATLATIRQETGSWRWTLFSTGLLFVLSMAAGIAIYQGVRLLGLGGL